MDPAISASAEKGMSAMRTAARKLHISTWNIAAINNNPFEYWITYDSNPAYEKLMVDVESFLENPGDKDVAVSQVFTEDMFTELDNKLVEVGWKSVKSYWDEDFKKRKIVSEFMKDTKLGSKRLASMPDRITNTINVEDSPDPVCRPTVINMYDGDLSDLTKWWAAWKQFMFGKALKIKGEEKIPYTMLKPIKKSKYPEITEVRFVVVMIVSMYPFLKASCTHPHGLFIRTARRKGLFASSDHVWSNFRCHSGSHDEFRCRTYGLARVEAHHGDGTQQEEVSSHYADSRS